MLRLHIEPNIKILDAETRQRYGEVYENLARLAHDVGKDSYDNSATTRFLLRQCLPDCEAALSDEDIELATRSNLAYYLAEPYQRMGQVKHALSLYKASLKAKQELGDVREIAVTQHEMADVLVQQGRVSEARGLYEQSLKAKQELGDVREIAVTQGAMADVLVQQGRVSEARGLYEQSLKAKQELGDVRGIAVTQHAMADVLVQQGRVSEARGLYEASLKVYEELGDVRSVAVTRGAMANVLVQQGRVGEAMELYEQSLKAKQELGDVRGIAVTQHAMADVLVQQGQVGRAMELYEQSLKAKQELGDVREIAVTQHAMADVLVQQGRVSEAMGLYEQSLKAKQELGDVQGIAVTQTNFGLLLWQQREYVKALVMVWQAYKSLPEQDFPVDIQTIQGFLVSFKENFSGEEQAFDALWQQATSEPQPVWLKDVQVGSSGRNVTLTEEEAAEIVEAVKALVNTENWDATQQVVEAQQEILFRPETELFFEQFIEQAKASGEQRVVELLEMHLAVLRECKADGIAATFERVKAMGQGEE